MDEAITIPNEDILTQQFIALKIELEHICNEYTTIDNLEFSGLFHRLIFITNKYQLPISIEQQLMVIYNLGAKLSSKQKTILLSQELYDKATMVVSYFKLFLQGENFDWQKLDTINLLSCVGEEILNRDKIRVQVLEVNASENYFVCQTNDLSASIFKVRYGVHDINDKFSDSMSQLWVGAQINLMDNSYDDYGFCIPQIIVLEPDYLIDASAIAECFQSYGTSHLNYFRRKFEVVSNSSHILKGLLANYFLDELIYSQNPLECKFHDIFQKSFSILPFEFSTCSDLYTSSAFLQFMKEAEQQFENIKRVIEYDLTKQNFDVRHCVLEPSFFSETYGFQGRLDLLQPASKKDEIDRIVELKSGKPPYPYADITRLAINHEVQTNVYRLMIQSAFYRQPKDISAYILYSSVNISGHNLRIAKRNLDLEKKIINIRNLIVSTEHHLYMGGDNTVINIFRQLFDTSTYSRLPDFVITRFNEFRLVLNRTTPIERMYFYRYIVFVSRELYIQKVGDNVGDSYTSLSALWNTSFDDRKQSLELLDNLTVEKLIDNENDLQIKFLRTELDECVNFREGEICILYPKNKGEGDILSNQILKATIAELTSSYIVLKFRYRQRNHSIFTTNRFWVIEHDKTDQNYNYIYQNLFAFLKSSASNKQLIMGLRKPSSSFIDSTQSDSINIQKQVADRIIYKALAAEDYFLLVGPPGTGKTSIFIKRLIKELYKNPDTNIVVMAYTNRAVDELCGAICSIFADSTERCEHYIRIGSELSCHPLYRHRMLKNVCSGLKNRKELLKQLLSNRIFVGTLAAFQGKQDLFKLKKFDIAIIDEASQILEPQIIGLLPNFKKFIMVGDHKQLSTITLQHQQKSKVTSPELNDIQLLDCRESLFERLYRLCILNHWENAYDTLIYHGRMHKDIANFVNARFYGNQLIEATLRQSAILDFKVSNQTQTYHDLIANNRIAFLPVKKSSYMYLDYKTNIAEAQAILDIVSDIHVLYEQNSRCFQASTIGIISPYRNQNALIRKMLDDTNIEVFKQITVDTVERYQGSQRDIIILSFCFNDEYQLNMFSNMDLEKKVDKKLNVALTRAREQMFMVGNPDILMTNNIYADLLKSVGYE